MNEPTNRILRALLRAGKAKPELDIAKAELGFDTRLMAAIGAHESVEESPWLAWHRAAWRLVPVMAAMALVLGILALLDSTDNGSSLTLLGDPLGLELVLANYLGGL